jgi:hypothetical protein
VPGPAGGDEAAEQFFADSIDRLGRTRIVTSLARAKLLFGEWLRRQGRKTDARDQLRAAGTTFLKGEFDVAASETAPVVA